MYVPSSAAGRGGLNVSRLLTMSVLTLATYLNRNESWMSIRLNYNLVGLAIIGLTTKLSEERLE